jgi:hypothetical protein
MSTAQSDALEKLFNSTIMDYLKFVKQKQPKNLTLEFRQSQFVLLKKSMPSMPILSAGPFLIYHREKLSTVSNLRLFFTQGLELEKFDVKVDKSVADIIDQARAVFFDLSDDEKLQLFNMLQTLLNTYLTYQALLLR